MLSLQGLLRWLLEERKEMDRDDPTRLIIQEVLLRHFCYRNVVQMPLVERIPTPTATEKETAQVEAKETVHHFFS